jgi:hypothetical protein
MFTPIDSFGRSAALEFVRSPLLERGRLAAVNIGSVTVAISNDVQGYYGPAADRWILYPVLRIHASVAGESQEQTLNWSPWPSVQIFTNDPIQLLEAAPSRILISESAGWAGLQMGSPAGPFEISRTATTSVASYTTLLGDLIVTRTVEGQPFDARAYRDLFWNACISTQAVWPQAPQAANPILFYQITSAGVLALGAVRPPFFQFYRPQSRFRISAIDLQPAGLNPASEAFRFRMALRFHRRRNAFDPVGEAVNGAFADFDADGVSVPFDCARGSTGTTEDVIPPRIPQATLDAMEPGLNWPLSAAERRLIPPDAAHPLITC